MTYVSNFFKKYPLVVVLLASFLLFLLQSIVLFDTDFGWHIKLGEYIATQGIPRSELYSYTMPSFPYVDLQWLNNLFFYFSYQYLGILGMSIVFSLLGMLSLYFVSTLAPQLYVVGPAILAIAIFISRFGIRAQVISWFLFAWILRICWTEKAWIRWRLVCPFIILLWSNLHGSFPLGLAFVLISCVYYSRQKQPWISLFIGILSIGATFLNPYGIGAWLDVKMQINNLSYMSSIQEWLPFWTRPDLSILALATIGGALALYLRSSLSLLHLFFVLITTYLAVSALRNGPLFALVMIPFTAELLVMFEKKIERIKYAKQRFWNFFSLMILVLCLICSAEVVVALEGARRYSYNTYPSSALPIIRKEKKLGHLFSAYNWGGYLIWQLPEEKVFIDGRMPSFQWNAPNTESSNAFQDYKDILEGKRVKELFDKYQITMVLLPVPVKQEFFLNRFFNVKEDTPMTIYEVLPLLGWKKLYQDNVSVIFSLPEQPH